MLSIVDDTVLTVVYLTENRTECVGYYRAARQALGA